MQPTSVTGLVAAAALAVALVVLLTTIDGAEAQLCPLCECPASYKPICGVTVDKGGRRRVRGFPSLCVMECGNQCRKNQYAFQKKGRCGPKLKATRKPEVNAENSAMDKGQAPSAAPFTLKTVPPE